MKFAGFSFIRNAITYDYPIREAILSILPICDKFYVAVGQSDDETRNLIEEIDSEKIVIIDTVWDDSLREGGVVLAKETDKAFQAIPEDFDWCFYIQGDEVFHEDGLEKVKTACEKYKTDLRVKGFVMNYKHFYGSYDYIGDSKQWYRREVRIIRNDKSIYSFRDAQGFQQNGRPLKVKYLDVCMHHYGWVKHPKYQQAKQQNFNKLWHSDDWVEKHIQDVDEFDYSSIDSVTSFKGTHPKVMQERIKRVNWQFTFDPTQKKLKPKAKFLLFIQKYTGWRIGEYRNYKIIK